MEQPSPLTRQQRRAIDTEGIVFVGWDDKARPCIEDRRDIGYRRLKGQVALTKEGNLISVSGYPKMQPT